MAYVPYWDTWGAVGAVAATQTGDGDGVRGVDADPRRLDLTLSTLVITCREHEQSDTRSEDEQGAGERRRGQVQAAEEEDQHAVTASSRAAVW